MRKNSPRNTCREYQKDCFFCQIFLKEKDKILDETETCILIKNKKKHRCKVHLLILSKSHITDTKSLKTDDLEMLVEMEQIADRAIRKYGGHGKQAVWDSIALLFTRLSTSIAI